LTIAIVRQAGNTCLQPGATGGGFVPVGATLAASGPRVQLETSTGSQTAGREAPEETGERRHLYLRWNCNNVIS